MNFKDYLIKKGIKINTATDTAFVKGMLVGRSIKILNQVGSHDYGPDGTKLKVGTLVTVGGDYIDRGKENGTGNNLKFTNFELFAGSTISDVDRRKAELETIIKEAKVEMEVLDMQKVHMQENGVEELTEGEWKIYEMLLTLKTTSRNDMQKAKAIAELLIPA